MERLTDIHFHSESDQAVLRMALFVLTPVASMSPWMPANSSTLICIQPFVGLFFSNIQSLTMSPSPPALQLIAIPHRRLPLSDWWIRVALPPAHRVTRPEPTFSGYCHMALSD